MTHSFFFWMAGSRFITDFTVQESEKRRVSYQDIQDCAFKFWNGYEEVCSITSICSQPCPDDHDFRCIETCKDVSVACKGSAENPDCKIQRECEDTYEEYDY